VQAGGEVYVFDGFLDHVVGGASACRSAVLGGHRTGTAYSLFQPLFGFRTHEVAGERHDLTPPE